MKTRFHEEVFKEGLEWKKEKKGLNGKVAYQA
jgi:hypothetical protein